MTTQTNTEQKYFDEEQANKDIRHQKENNLIDLLQEKERLENRIKEIRVLTKLLREEIKTI